MTTYNQDYRNETGEKAERNSTIVEFYDRCRKSADERKERIYKLKKGRK